MRNIILLNLLLFICFTSYGQTGCEIVDFSTTVKVKTNKLIEEKTYIIQINNKDSDWITDIEIPYKEQEKLNILEASIIDLFGNTIRKLKKKEIITRNDRSRIAFYEDNWVKEFKLKWNQYPYRIKYKYRKTKDKFIFVTQWHPLVYTNVQTNKASLSVVLPSNYDVTINASKELKHDVSVTDESQTLHWEAKNISTIHSESFSPPIQDLIPSVKIVPQDFKYGIKGSFDTWSSFGEWHEKMNAGLDILTPAEKIKINQLIEGINDKREIVRILYHYLQDNTRYINVAIDIGGLKPYPASYVCENKYGDCKALTNYMKALLKYAGIRSYYTKIYSDRNPIRIDTQTPCQQFNHIILSVPFENDTIWLENTDKHNPYNYLGTFTQDRHALLVNGSESKLVKTKALTLEEILEKNSYTFNLDIEGKGNLHVSKNLKGEAFEKYQYIRYELGEKDQKQQIEDDLPLKNYDIQTWEITQKNRDSQNLFLKADLKVENQFRKIGNMIVLKPVINPFFHLEKPQTRRNRIRINYPTHQNDTIIYNLPFMDKYEVELPKNLTIMSEYGSYKVNYTQLNNQLIVSQVFQLNAGEYSLNDYPHIYNFSENIQKSLTKSVIILNQL